MGKSELWQIWTENIHVVLLQAWAEPEMSVGVSDWYQEKHHDL